MSNNANNGKAKHTDKLWLHLYFQSVKRKVLSLEENKMKEVKQ